MWFLWSVGVQLPVTITIQKTTGLMFRKSGFPITSSMPWKRSLKTLSWVLVQESKIINGVLNDTNYMILLCLVTALLRENSHTIHSFKMYNAVTFTIVTGLWDHHLTILEHFHHSKKKPYNSFTIFPIYSQFSNPLIYSLFIDLLILDISYKWNHKIHGRLWLASFTYHNVFKVHLLCRIY